MSTELTNKLELNVVLPTNDLVYIRKRSQAGLDETIELDHVGNDRTEHSQVSVSEKP